MPILLLADIHGNFPALEAIAAHFSATTFSHVINCGDSLVYGPFANETMAWLADHDAISILGNTDKKVIKLLQGKSFTKPRREDKRIMYTSTAAALTHDHGKQLCALPIATSLVVNHPGGPDSATTTIGIFHGSPAEPHEFLFADSPDDRFEELAASYPFPIVVTGHSHSPYAKRIAGCLFINPGSVGRMFDGNPAASCAVLEFSTSGPKVKHYRIPYDTARIAAAIRAAGLPEIYATMFTRGLKLN